MKHLFTLLLALTIYVNPGQAQAKTGSEACQDISVLLSTKSILVSCEYVTVPDTGGQYMYRIFLVNTPHSGQFTVMLIAAAVNGADKQVPTKTMGMGLTNGSSTMVWYMDSIRTCAKNFIHDDSLFTICIANAGTGV